MIDNSGIEIRFQCGNLCVHVTGVRHCPDISCSCAELKRYQEQSGKNYHSAQSEKNDKGDRV